jgi:hypothetical protein
MVSDHRKQLAQRVFWSRRELTMTLEEIEAMIDSERARLVAQKNRLASDYLKGECQLALKHLDDCESILLREELPSALDFVRFLMAQASNTRKFVESLSPNSVI